MTKPRPDFTLADHGSICILTPITRRAEEWTKANIDAPTSWCKGVVVEPRYVAAIVTGIAADGMEVQ